MLPLRSPLSSVRTGTVLLLGGLALAALLLGGCGRHRRVVRLDPDDADVALPTGAPTSRSISPVVVPPPATATPVGPIPSPSTPLPVPTGWTDAQKVRDRVGEVLTEQDRLRRERERRERETASSGFPTPETHTSSGEVFGTPLPRFEGIPLR